MTTYTSIRRFPCFRNTMRSDHKLNNVECRQARCQNTYRPSAFGIDQLDPRTYDGRYKAFLQNVTKSNGNVPLYSTCATAPATRRLCYFSTLVDSQRDTRVHESYRLALEGRLPSSCLGPKPSASLLHYGKSVILPPHRRLSLRPSLGCVKLPGFIGFAAVVFLGWYD